MERDAVDKLQASDCIITVLAGQDATINLNHDVSITGMHRDDCTFPIQCYLSDFTSRILQKEYTCIYQ